MALKLVAAEGQVVCPGVTVAETAPARMKGLLGRQSLKPGEGLLLRPAASIHTAFMRFALDVVFLDRDLRVLRVAPNVAPWRLASHRGAKAVLELSAGAAQLNGVEAGMLLRLTGADRA